MKGRVINKHVSLWLLACVGTAMLTAAAPAQEPTVNPQAALLADFTARVKAYTDLRDKAKAGLPPLKETANPAEISAAEKALAAKVRALRATAKPADIFTPEIAKRLRMLLVPETTGRDGAQTRATVKDDQPFKVPLVVNAAYPDDEPMTTVPPNILQSLPKLPDGIEYRFVHRYMILRDAQANIIVDFMPNAIR